MGRTVPSAAWSRTPSNAGLAPQRSEATTAGQPTRTPQTLWEAAQSVKLSDTRTLGRLVRWRIPDTPASVSFRELFSRYPFTELDVGPTWQLSGLCGSIWTLQRDYPRLSGPEDYEAWDEKGTVQGAVRALDPPGRGGPLGAHQRGARAAGRPPRGARLKVLWAVIAPFERLIGAEPLNVAASRARDPQAASRR